MNNPRNIFTFLFLCLFTYGCATVPYTGRQQLLVTSESEENQMGEQAWREILSKNRLSKNRKYVEATRRVGKNIAKVVNKPGYKWEFKVIDSDQANAFCLPGGKIAVYSGLFKFVDNDAELAAVVGHEVAHAVARHGGERMSHAFLQNLGGAVLSKAVDKDQAIWMLAYGAAAQLGAVLPYSRKHEYEADYLGLIFMAKAGYNSQAALDFWGKFSKLSKTDSISEFFSTHPMSEKRMNEMNLKMPEAKSLYNKAPVKRGNGKRYR